MLAHVLENNDKHSGADPKEKWGDVLPITWLHHSSHNMFGRGPLLHSLVLKETKKCYFLHFIGFFKNALYHTVLTD